MTGEDRAETLAVAQQQGDSLHLERAGERFENLLDRLRQVPVGDMAQTRKDQLAQAQALQLVLLAVGLPVEVGDVHAQQQRASQAVERLHRLETTGQWRGGIAAQRQVETLAPAQAGQRRRTGGAPLQILGERPRLFAKPMGALQTIRLPPADPDHAVLFVHLETQVPTPQRSAPEGGPSCEGSGLSASADDERENSNMRPPHSNRLALAFSVCGRLGIAPTPGKLSTGMIALPGSPYGYCTQTSIRDVALT